MSDPVIALRHKYAEDLEEILQCPVCFENLAGPVPVCIQGHHTCYKCQPRVQHCPMCQSPFNGTRNYLAESIISKFDEIKISLIDPTHKLNQRVVTNIVSVETQTDLNLVEANVNLHVPITNIQNDVKKNFVGTPIVGKGKYPCRIGDCSEEHAYGRMIPHMRYKHGEQSVILESTMDSFYRRSWELVYDLNQMYDKAINIPKLGLFFLKLAINDQGDLYGNVQIVNTRLAAQQYQYSLEICNAQSSTSYKGEVLACRTTKSRLTEKCLYVHNMFLRHLLRRNQTFYCNLVITRLSNLALKEDNHKNVTEEP